MKLRKESNRGHKGWSGESATSFSSDTLSLRSKLFSKIVAGLSPVLLFYIVVNLSSSNFLFLGQNILLLGILVGAYFLLHRGSYDSAVTLLFAGGMLVVQLSFLAGELFPIEEMPAGWTHFAVVNACLTVLIAAAFSRRRGQLILIDSVMGVTLLTHQVLYILGERGNLPDSLGLVFYFGIAVGFSFLIQALFKKQGILLEDRKRLNHDLEMKNNQLQLFMNTSPDFFFLKDLNLRYLMHNSPLPTYVDCGIENLTGLTDVDFFPADRAQDIRKADLEVLSTGRMVVQKQEINDRIFEIRRIPVIMKKEVNGVAGLVRDITEQIKKESLITDLLAEKEQLLREVHHRIKNHMYTISSILSLQSAEFSDPTVIAAFDETRRRIRLMQSIYEKLYTGRDTGTIELGDYLNELLDDLRSAFCKNGRIVLIGDLREMHVSANIAFAVGIIINELITNSFKYAFAPVEEGRISIFLRGIPPSTIEITVADDGMGAPPEVLDGSRSGFGLTLVRGYARQFDGSMKMENSEGLTVTVTLRTDNPET